MMISKVHFLIHPGWIFKDNPLARFHKGSNDLMERYVEKAKTLQPDELMVAFAPAIDSEFVRDFRKNNQAYTKVVRAIKEVLGSRLIVLADSDEDKDANRGAAFKENKDKAWRKIQTIAKERGFTFKQELTAEAYGELMKACVVLIADQMHEAAGMSEQNPVMIKLDLTDYPIFLEFDEYYTRLREARLVYGDNNIYLTPRTKVDFPENTRRLQ